MKLHRRPARGVVNIALNVSGNLVSAARGLFMSWPLLLVDAVAVWHVGLTWAWLAVLPATILASLAAITLSGNLVRLPVMLRVRNFLREYAHCRLTLHTISDYLPSLARPAAAPATAAKAPPPRAILRPHPDEHLDHALAFASAPLDDDGVPIILVQAGADRRGPLPACLVSYPSMGATTIFVRERPDTLGGFQRFVLLHELGHASLRGKVIVMAMQAGGLVAFAVLPVIAAKLAYDLRGLAVLALTAAAAYVARRFYYRTLTDQQSRLYDEVAADLFALRRCDPEWLRKQRPDVIAGHVCRDSAMADSRQQRLRRRMLISNIRRLARGRPPRREMQIAEISVRTGPARLLEWLPPLALACAGWFHGPLTVPRVSLIWGVTIALAAVAIVVHAGLELEDRALLDYLRRPRGDGNAALRTGPLLFTAKARQQPA